MTFPVFKCVNGAWKLHAIYIDFNKLMCEWDQKYGSEFCWEPWPVDKPFDEAFYGACS